MQKLILTNFQSPGDTVVLTAAVRDLHTCYPGQFLTDVRTGWPELWLHNSYLTPLDTADPEVRIIECGYPLIESANRRPVHFLDGFIENLNRQLDLRITVTRCGGDVHLAAAEKLMPSPVEQVTGLDVPYWIIVAGGKYDYTIKWWHFRRWQWVVDHFRSRLLFVQIGDEQHYHPGLSGVLDLRGKTTLRDVVRLVYHADGVLCPVTFLMHLAAAIEGKSGGPKSRPCVVVAGGREPPHWETYPTHQFIHTVGLLPCCAQGGCWRSRSVPLGDGDEKDHPEHLCVDVVEYLPRCMDLITPEVVANRIELCLAGGSWQPLTARQRHSLKPFLARRYQTPLGAPAQLREDYPTLPRTNTRPNQRKTKPFQHRTDETMRRLSILPKPICGTTKTKTLTQRSAI